MQVVASKELSPPVFNGAVSTDVSPPAALKECRTFKCVMEEQSVSSLPVHCS